MDRTIDLVPRDHGKVSARRMNLILRDLKPEDVARAVKAMKITGITVAQATRNVNEALRLHRLEKKGE